MFGYGKSCWCAGSNYQKLQRMRGLTRIFPLPLSPFQLSKADKGLMLLSFTLAFCELFNILGFSTFKINNVLMAGLMAVSSLIYGLFRGARFNGLYILYFCISVHQCCAD